jgi:hypothetical protein
LGHCWVGAAGYWAEEKQSARTKREEQGAAEDFPSEAGPEERKGKEKGFAYLERDFKKMKFKFKFEFRQTNYMHQHVVHVCNKHQANYLIWQNK